jgi:tetratricopeptide (TPR) repeat protein
LFDYRPIEAIAVPPESAPRRLTLPAANAIIDEIYARGMEFVVDRGYACFLQFTLALKVASDAPQSGRQVKRLAGAFALYGDLCDVHLDAQRAAIRAYRACLRLNPDHAWAWCELGNSYELLGYCRRAEHAYRHALALDPNGQKADAALRLESLLELWDVRGELPTKSVARLGQSREALARGQARGALRILAGLRGIDARLHRARVYAALGDLPRYWHEWQNICHATGEVWYGHPDWFCTPRLFRQSVAYWRLIESLVERIDIVPLFVHFESCEMKKIFPNRSRSLFAKSNRRCQLRRTRLYLDLRISEASRDFSAVQSLCHRYPNWQDPKRLLAHLASLVD